LTVGERFLSATAGNLECVAAFTIVDWNFDESSLPADHDNFTWLFLADTDMITGDWQPYGQAMADGAAGFDMLQPAVAPMQNYSDVHVRNVTLGYTPIVTGWTVWNI
jgi:hypothetical protein